MARNSYGRHGEVCERTDGKVRMTIRQAPIFLDFEKAVALVFYGCVPVRNNNFYHELKSIGKQAFTKNYWVERLKHYCSFLNVDEEEAATFDYWCNSRYSAHSEIEQNLAIWSDIEDHLRMIFPAWENEPSLTEHQDWEDIRGEEE